MTQTVNPQSPEPTDAAGTATKADKPVRKHRAPKLPGRQDWRSWPLRGTSTGGVVLYRLNTGS